MSFEADELKPELKEQIDKMTHYQMCSIWRFAKSGSPYITGNMGEYFKERLFTHFGGFTPEISKDLGW